MDDLVRVQVRESAQDLTRYIRDPFLAQTAAHANMCGIRAAETCIHKTHRFTVRDTDSMDLEVKRSGSQMLVVSLLFRLFIAGVYSVCVWFLVNIQQFLFSSNINKFCLEKC